MLNQNNPQDNTEMVYFSHGGGPLPILGDTSHKAMVDFMVQLPARLRKSICCRFMYVYLWQISRQHRYLMTIFWASMRSHFCGDENSKHMARSFPPKEM
jgi:hypothetical protein